MLSPQIIQPEREELTAHRRLSRAGGRHPADKCRFKESDCHHCGKKGHLAKVCRSRKRENAAKKSQNQTARAKTRTRSQTAHHVVEETESVQSTRTASIPSHGNGGSLK